MQKNKKLNVNRIVQFALIVVGIACVGLSAFYASSYLAILSVSFIFWGGILLYITPSKHVPLSFLTASNAANMSNMERLLSELKFTEKGICLPPTNLQDPESSLIFIPQVSKQSLPQSEEEKTCLFNNQRDGLFLTPPGFALSKLFEQKLGVSFTKIDLPQIQKNLQKLLIDDMEIAENIEIQIIDDKVIFEITGNVFQEDCQEAQKFPQTHNAIGCLLSSSIACALAKATGRPIVIENEELSKDKKTTKIEYRIMEE
jgi:hypothetical protein